MTTEQIARVCHEVNRAYCEAIGDKTQKVWEQAEGWQHQSAVAGVQMRLDCPGAPTEAQHESWFKQKQADGWKYGAVKDVSKKEHPCMVPFDQLPEQQKAKDYLFVAVVESLRPYVLQAVA